MQRRPERMSSLDVDRGLYVLRYMGAAEGDAPTIFVRASPGSDENVDFVGYPGESATRLGAPGSITVIAVDAPATLQITAQATSAGGSLQAEVRLESLRPGAPAAIDPLQAMPVRSAPTPAAAVLPGRDLMVSAHVARRGDVVPQEEGAWLGGPDMPAPIEGLSLQVAPHLGVLHYRVLMSGETRWADWVVSGGFAGSRGRARPLTGVQLRLIPAQGVRVSLEGEALFLGSAVVRKTGLELEFRSAAGLDPLVGFRVALDRPMPVAATKPNLLQASAPTGRVRVFKASSGRRAG